MVAFILRRFVSMLFVLLCVVTLTFCMVRLMPGGPFTQERKAPPATEKELLARFNLGGPLWQQYAIYLGVMRNATGNYSGLLEGDLQPSLKYRSRTVAELLAQTLPVTMTLGLVAFIIAAFAGVWLGSLAAVRHNTPVDTGAMLSALFAISIPPFITGPLLILIVAIYLRWLPAGGWGGLRALVLPSLTLAAPYVAYIARLMRSSMLEVLGQDFIRTAKAKGLADGPVVYKHALKVAILPVVSYLGPLAANLLTGSLVVETVFNIPGAGVFFVSSIENRDGFLLCGVVMVYCALLVGLNLLVDIAYTWLDRRIKLYE
ncbi:MAG TPA: ABC transporter permease [Chthoniobacteraceae bacterium]|nr:ABC transporter permease [Chthoniobacteraceae bacterium]